jgi:hypothetical protein
VTFLSDSHTTEIEPHPSARTKWAWSSIALAWVIVVLGGMFTIMRYANTPSAKDVAPSAWPKESRLLRSPQQPTLVMFAHPRCPCTRASIAELSKLVTRVSGRLAAHVLFMRPPGVEERWEETDIVRRAREIPGVTTAVDADGREAALFRASTSGETILYGADGRLLFHGGITPSRGHEGDNSGLARVVSLINTGAADQSESAVYGCALLDGGAPGTP